MYYLLMDEKKLEWFNLDLNCELFPVSPEFQMTILASRPQNDTTIRSN